MDLSRTTELLPRVIWRDSSPSTNAELRALVAAASKNEASAAGAGAGAGTGAATAGDREGSLSHGTLLVTADQPAGRGRLDRGWVMPPGTAIAASLYLRNGATAHSELGPGWLSLMAGAAMATALQPCFGPGMRVGVKWPNDVHVRDEDDAIAGRPGLKLVGILSEMLPDGSVIVGTGINLLLNEWELPTERATSLLVAGADVGGAESLDDPAGAELADRVLAAYSAEMLRLVALAAKNPEAVRVRVARASVTLGAEVRVHLPGGQLVDGRARRLAADGSLVIDLPTGGELEVSAGDVEHLR